jgi:hypothetical protein
VIFYRAFYDFTQRRCVAEPAQFQTVLLPPPDGARNVGGAII